LNNAVNSAQAVVLPTCVIFAVNTSSATKASESVTVVLYLLFVAVAVVNIVAVVANAVQFL